jgi:hypothetical protein
MHLEDEESFMLIEEESPFDPSHSAFQWVHRYGSSALKKALKHGYEVEKGMADLIANTLKKHTHFDLHTSWKEIEERTSPNEASFEGLEHVEQIIGHLDLPPGWKIRIGRISRICYDFNGKAYRKTGIPISIFARDYPFDQKSRLVKKVFLDFEVKHEI